MSYILEALKKAQAERQLGSAPTIHALPLHAPVAPLPGRRGPFWIGLAALLLVLALLAWFLRPPASAPATVTAAAAPATVTASAAPAPLAPGAAPAVSATLAAASVKAAPAAFAVRAEAPLPVPVVRADAPPAAVPARLAHTEQPPRPAPPIANPEESLPSLRELPEALQRALPQVVFGGYIYSSNPADRLLLIDKVLRHEGEEVAPGLVLEKLQPKSAVMNYRGTRYRVAY